MHSGVRAALRESGDVRFRPEADLK